MSAEDHTVEQLARKAPSVAGVADELDSTAAKALSTVVLDCENRYVVENDVDVADRASILKAYRSHVNKGLARLSQMSAAPVEVSSSGPLVFTADDKTYLDCGGFGVFILGHCHPKVVRAAVEQLQRHPVATRLLVNPLLAEASTLLAESCPPDLQFAYFACSGAEAVEASLKLGRLCRKSSRDCY